MNMAIKTIDVDNILKQSLVYTDEPSMELISRVKHYSEKEVSNTRTSYRPRFVAVAATIALMLALGTVALAASGVLGDVFAALSGDWYYGRNRQAIVDSGLVAEVVSSPLTDDSDAAYDDGIQSLITTGEGLNLRAYYVDGKTVWLDMELAGQEIPDGFDWLNVNNFKLEMTHSDGTVSTWSQSYDSENDIESRTFPGGRYYSDNKNKIHEYEPGSGNDFYTDVRFVKTDNGAYNITLIVSFQGAVVDVGESVKVEIGELIFNNPGRLEDDNAVMQYHTVEGDWAFEFGIDEMFGNLEPLRYTPSVSGAVQGIEILSITAIPTVTRIEAIIDFSVCPLADPDSEETARQRVASGDTPSMDYYDFLAKFNVMSVGVSAYDEQWLEAATAYREWQNQKVEEARLAEERGDTELADALQREIGDARTERDEVGNYYSGGSSSFDYETGVNGCVVTCWFEINGGLYFDAPENITLYFNNYGNNTTIEIPITLVR